jgi:hypothetical protein
MATTASDQINGALRLIGQLAEGEVPSAATAQDALSAMNQMLDSWNTERLMVYTTQKQVFSWPALTATRTLGPTGNFVGNRPVALDDSSYFVDPTSGVSTGIRIVNQAQYNAISLKSSTSTYPQIVLPLMGFPDLSLTVYPVPTMVLDWHIVSVEDLTQAASLSTTLAFPPGYLRAFKYNLACEVAAEFGVEPSPTVSRIAMVSKRNLKRINAPDDIMSLPRSLLGSRYQFNIFSGES